MKAGQKISELKISDEDLYTWAISQGYDPDFIPEEYQQKTDDCDWPE